MVKINTSSYSAFEANLAHTFDRVNDDHVPILITRENGKPAVIVSLEDFNAYEQAANLRKLEDAAMVRAIQEGENSETISRADLFKLFETQSCE